MEREYKKLDTTISKKNFAQMIDIENNCGLPPYSAEELQDCIENLVTFGCFENGDIVGYITMNLSPAYNNSLYMVNLNVAKTHQRQSIAKRLMYEVYKYYSAAITDAPVALDVEKTNTAAYHLYCTVGFKVLDIPSRNGDTDYVMGMGFTEFGENLEKLLSPMVK